MGLIPISGDAWVVGWSAYEKQLIDVSDTLSKNKFKKNFLSQTSTLIYLVWWTHWDRLKAKDLAQEMWSVSVFLLLSNLLVPSTEFDS